MDPITMGAISAGGSILGGVLGGIFSGGDKDKAEAALNEAENLIKAVGAGPDLARQIYYNSFQQAGVLVPELEQAIDFEHSQKIKEQPEMRQEQSAALDAIKQLSRTGLGVEDLAALNKVRLQAAQDAQAKSNQIIQQMAQRGQAGGGAELAMQIAAQQQGAQAEAEANDRIGAQASSARRDALSQLFSGAGQMRGTDLSLAAQNTGIENQDINFRNLNSQQRNRYNTQLQNQINQQNLERQQRIADMNIGQQNAELLRQRQAEQQMYENKLRQAQALAGIKGQRAQQYMGNAAATQQSWSNIGQGLGQGIAGIGTAMNNQAFQDKLLGSLSGNNPIIAAQQTNALNSFSLDPNQNLLRGIAGRAHGGKIEGPEVVKGDHEANDIIPAMLSAGEVVVPKSKAKDPEKAKEFVAKVNKEKPVAKKIASKKKVMSSLSDLLKHLNELED